jgi:hypothetical protein
VYAVVCSDDKLMAGPHTDDTPLAIWVLDQATFLFIAASSFHLVTDDWVKALSLVVGGLAILRIQTNGAAIGERLFNPTSTSPSK